MSIVLVERQIRDQSFEATVFLLQRAEFSQQMSVDRKRFSSCPIERTLAVLYGGWKGTVAWNLFSGGKRYSDLLRLASGVSHP